MAEELTSMRKIKKYCVKNVSIKITDFQLLDVSIYGCDARFYFEIRDKETGVLLDTDCETIENAFMGVDDDEEIYYFLEEKGIDFSEEYDDDYDQLPDELKKEYEEYELNHYNELYHNYFFESEEETQEEYVDKVMDQFRLPKNKFYIVNGDTVDWIEATSDYFGVHLSSDGIKIHRVYNMNMEDWIYEADGVYFNIGTSDWGISPDFYIEFFKRDDKDSATVTAEDMENDMYSGYDGKAGDVLYNYIMIYNDADEKRH